MAEDKDDAERSEDPTAKRLKDAADKGDVAKSAELSGWIVLLVATGLVATSAGPTAASIAALGRALLAGAGNIAVDGKSLTGLSATLVGGIVVALALPFGALMFAGLLGNIVQHRPTVNLEKIQPKLEKISPLKGFKRVFGPQAVVNLLKGLGKIAIVGTAAIVALWPERDWLAATVQLAPASLLELVQREAVKLLAAVVISLILVVLLDVAYQRFTFWQRMKMSRREIKDEFKQTEGDPHVKARLRQIRSERMRRRMMQAVPQATVVVTNPTHFAVALKYEPETEKMRAPVCVAKGADLVAQRIRQLAEEHKVPIVENPPLARTLYATVDIDAEVPPEHYQAVAQVIGFVWRLRAKAKGRGGARAGR
ncbi:MAG: flagellar biosynthesis protein FlhB [Alphaproteobacteria bacterium]|nr:flagellar biosynthesis protein FlhB [Alphaproteobacteria bacterium]